MNRYNRPDAGRQRGLNDLWIEAVVGDGNIDRPRDRSDLGDSLPRGRERHGRNDYLVAGADVRRGQRKTQRIQSTGKSDAVGRMAVTGERRLEGGDLRAVDERRRRDDVLHIGHDALSEGSVRCGQIKERNVDRRAVRHVRIVGEPRKHRASVARHSKALRNRATIVAET